jgi:hypothetical protein
VGDGDPLIRPVVGQEVARKVALEVVAADEAEHAFTLVGEPRVGRAPLEMDDPGLPEDRCGSERSTRAGPAEDHRNAIAHQLAGGKQRLLRVARIIGDDQPQRLAQDTARGIEVGDRELRARRGRLAYPGVRPGQGGAEPDQGLCTGISGTECHKRSEEEGSRSDHGCLSDPCAASMSLLAVRRNGRAATSYVDRQARRQLTQPDAASRSRE